MPEIAAILRNTVTTTGTLEGREDKLHALFNDVAAFSDDTARLPRRERRQPHPARPARRRPAAGVREVRPGVPLPDRRHRQRRQAPGRGVPRLHAAHRARDAAEPAARLRRRRTRRASARHRGPNCLHLPEPAVDAGQPGAAPAGLQRRRRRADRQGHQPGRRPLRRDLAYGAGYAGSPEEAATAQVAARTRPGLTPDRRPRPRACSWSGRWRAGRRCRCDEASSTRRPPSTWSSCSSSSSSPRSPPASWWSPSATSPSARPRSTRPSSPTPPASSRATTSGSPASRSASSRTSRSSTAPGPWSPSPSQTTRADQQARRNAAIRYRNLVGQRYISLTDEIGDSQPAATTAPPSRSAQTSPALDLTVLFNGFKPLFQALSPVDINKLSYEIVQVFQGEGGTLEGLLAHTASVTSDPGRPRPGHRRPDRQPQRGARPHRRPRRPAQPADHDLPHLRRRAEEGPPGDPRLARPDLRALGADRRPRLRASASRSSTTSSSCAASRATSTATRPRSTARCRCCRSS